MLQAGTVNDSITIKLYNPDGTAFNTSGYASAAITIVPPGPNATPGTPFAPTTVMGNVVTWKTVSDSWQLSGGLHLMQVRFAWSNGTVSKSRIIPVRVAASPN